MDGTELDRKRANLGAVEAVQFAGSGRLSERRTTHDDGVIANAGRAMHCLLGSGVEASDLTMVAGGDLIARLNGLT